MSRSDALTLSTKLTMSDDLSPTSLDPRLNPDYETLRDPVTRFAAPFDHSSLEMTISRKVRCGYYAKRVPLDREKNAEVSPFSEY